MDYNMKMSPAMEALTPEQIEVLNRCLRALPEAQRYEFEEKELQMTTEQLRRFVARANSMNPEEIQRNMEQIARMTPEQRRALAEERAKKRPEELARLSREKALQQQREQAQKSSDKKGGKAQDAGAALKRLLGYLGRQKTVMLFGMITSILATLFSLAAPKLLSKALDRLQVVVDTGLDLQYGKVVEGLIILGAFYVLTMVFLTISNQLFSKATQQTVFQMRKDVDRKLMKLPFSYFDAIPKGDILSRLTNDIENIGTALQQSMAQVVTAVLTIIGSL